MENTCVKLLYMIAFLNFLHLKHDNVIFYFMSMK